MDRPAIPADEVDLSLIDWFLSLSVRARLRAASEAAATLDRLARAVRAGHDPDAT